MAVILVDYENVSGANGLRGTDALCEKDRLIIFYSGCCGKIRYDSMQEIKNSGCEFRVVKLKEAGKNALDFYIAAECGIMSERGEKQIAIISNDKGFQAVIDFFQVAQYTEKVQIVKAGNIEEALALLSAPEDANRRRIIQQKRAMLDLASECARLEEKNRIRNEIQDIVRGTEFEEKTAEIIDFVNVRKAGRRKDLYTGALHCFGRRDGIAIYQLIKRNLPEKQQPLDL